LQVLLRSETALLQSLAPNRTKSHQIAPKKIMLMAKKSQFEALSPPSQPLCRQRTWAKKWDAPMNNPLPGVFFFVTLGP
jgi:hypothetical protein